MFPAVVVGRNFERLIIFLHSPLKCVPNQHYASILLTKAVHSPTQTVLLLLLLLMNIYHEYFACVYFSTLVLCYVAWETRPWDKVYQNDCRLLSAAPAQSALVFSTSTIMQMEKEIEEDGCRLIVMINDIDDT